MENPAETSYYKRFRSAALRFEWAGGILLAAGAGVHLLSGGSLGAASLLLAGPGALLLVIGGSSLQPHNLVKSFAQQCAREPGPEMAQGLLDALEASQKIRVMAATIQMVQAAVAVYESTDGADGELVRRLKEAAETRLVRKAF